MTRNESNGRGPLQRTEVLLEVVFRAFEQHDATPDQDDQGKRGKQVHDQGAYSTPEEGSIPT